MHVAKIQKVLGIWKPRIGVGWRLVSCVNLEESFHSKITELRPSDPPLANLNIPRTPPPPIPAGSAQVWCFCDITRVILGGEGMGHGVLIRTNFLRHDIVIVKKIYCCIITYARKSCRLQTDEDDGQVSIMIII